METLALPCRKTDRFWRMRMGKNLNRFREWQQGYKTLYLEQNHFKSRMLEKRNIIPKKKVIIEQ